MVETAHIRNLCLLEDGAQLLSRAAVPVLDKLMAALVGVPSDQAGIRLFQQTDLAALLGRDSVIGAAIAPFCDEALQPVRAVLFDKTSSRNWALGWHQDRTICVKSRCNEAGYGPWTIKNGMVHVEPPFDLLARMMTVRIHLDAVPNENAPLLIAPGSHLRGRIPVSEIEAVVAQCGSFACLAESGDIWIYATTILHASARSTQDGRRRVLQVDYSPDNLPDPMAWAGI
jgi:hypothetical protein